jgi:hypothetical protein
MTTPARSVPARPLPSLRAVLYRLTDKVFLPDPQPGAQSGTVLSNLAEAFGQRNLVMTRALHASLAGLNDEQLEALAPELLNAALSLFGAHKAHIPLFRNFRRTTPQDTYLFYLQRLIAAQDCDPGVPCAVSGDDALWGLSRAPSVTPQAACTYGMFDSELFGGCPVCHRRVGPEELLSREGRQLIASQEKLRWLRKLDLGTDQAATVRELLSGLLARTTPLNSQDRDNLRVLLTECGADALSLLPDKVSQRETLAFVLGSLLNVPGARDAVLERFAEQVRTATDLLRIFDVAGGGDATLVGRLGRPKLPRSLRRAFLAQLEALDARNLTEDLHRHPGLWKRAGEVLHPFEFAQSYPNVALAFAALRGSLPGSDALGEQLRTGRLPGLRAGLSGRLRFNGWAGLTEKALAAGDVPEALRLLSQRPGELGRRLDALLRLTLRGDSEQCDPEQGAPEHLSEVQDSVVQALPKLTTPMLLLLRAHLAARTGEWPVRLVFPKGSAQSFALPDRRDPLPESVTAPLRAAMEAELLRRAALLPRYASAVLDARLRDLPMPAAERHAARALVTLPRGARLSLPPGRFARLFVHWMEHESQRVDLDLSAVFYDANWKKLGDCSYTSLRFAGTGAIHSGDLTSAPAPLGASEFIDLDAAALRGAGVRYVVMSVLSYNGVAFEDMAEAFAGYMLRDSADGPVFDARTVEQRYDLRGKEEVSVPLALDLATGDPEAGDGLSMSLHWLDTVPKARTFGHVVGQQVGIYTDALALAASRIIESAGVGARSTLWDLAALHAAARTDEVAVLTETGPELHRRGDDSPAAFLARLNGPGEPSASPLPTGPTLGAYLYRAYSLPPGSQAIALRDDLDALNQAGMTEELDVQSRTFAELLSDLAPEEASGKEPQ